jgi:predicted RNA-binding protein YlxR (DUF448 family)
MCCVCRTRKPPAELVRVAKIQRGNVTDFVLDTTHRGGGRGAYVCKNSECIDKCIKTRAFNKSFKTNVPPVLYEIIKIYQTK